MSSKKAKKVWTKLFGTPCLKCGKDVVFEPSTSGRIIKILMNGKYFPLCVDCTKKLKDFIDREGVWDGSVELLKKFLEET